jgi:hypothetical protein
MAIADGFFKYIPPPSPTTGGVPTSRQRQLTFHHLSSSQQDPELTKILKVWAGTTDHDTCLEQNVLKSTIAYF